MTAYTMSLIDLHNHLYGSLSAEILFKIGKQNPSPRWSLFTDLYKKLYGKEINTESFFEDYKDINVFKEFYLFNKPAPFLEFQAKFNLIIALIVFDEDEIRFVTKEILKEQFVQGVDFAEYRIMYPPNASFEVYKLKTIAACQGFYEGEKSLSYKVKGRLAVSLHRAGNFTEQYEWLKLIMKESEIVKEYLVGIDFCNIEEGFPPKEKKAFFEKVLLDNEKNPQLALSILYHVGESYQDKTPISAVRWVTESALFGAHRLGHCLALGINPETFKDKIILEKVSERIDHLEFEIQNYEKMKAFGINKELSLLKKEKENLERKNLDDKISFSINKKYIDEMFIFQEFSMNLILEETSAIIESCPTSNLYIGMLPEIKDHPISRFIKNGMKVTIGSDDLGIFDTTLKREYELAAKAGLSSSELEKIKAVSNSFISERVSGRLA